MGPRPQRAAARCTTIWDEAADRTSDRALSRRVRHPRAAQRGGADSGEGQGRKGEPTLDARAVQPEAVWPPTFFHGKPDYKASQEPREALRIYQKASAGSSARRFQRTPHGSTSGRSYDSRPGHQRGDRDQVPQQADRRRARHSLHRDAISLPASSTLRVEATTTRATCRTALRSFPCLAPQDHPRRTARCLPLVPDLAAGPSGPTPSSTSEYGLTKDEIAFIESQVAEHDTNCSMSRATKSKMSKPPSRKSLRRSRRRGRASTPTRSTTRPTRACSRSARPPAT